MKLSVLVTVVVACCFVFACGQNGTTPTMNDLKTASSSSSSSPIASQSEGPEHHDTAPLVPVGGSGVTGHVTIEALPKGGVNISVTAFNLIPGTEYLSLYYENSTCELEEYEEDDVIGFYVANAAGVGHAENKLEDDLDEVNSISVRRASDFALLSCATIEH
jgi:hypothetical protein